MLAYLRWFFRALFLFLSAVSTPFTDADEPKPTPKQIAQWIDELGDNDFKVRENASKKLWQAGAAAEAALEKALKSDDVEVARRARDLLEKFRWGIYPDTPEEIVALIRAYQSSQGPPRLEVLQKLLDSGDAGLRAIPKIIAAERDENQRKILGDLVVQKLPSAFLRAVTEGLYEPFERLLEFGHESKFIDSHLYAAYWLLRGRLAERIAHFRTRLNEHPQDTWLAQTLAYLFRANGALLEARKAAEKSGRADLLEGILYELGDWQALAERSHLASVSSPIEKWAYRAAFTRLAGKQQEFENAVRQLRKYAENKADRDSAVLVAAKGLLLNDRPTEGLEVLRTLPEHHDLLFEILCARLDFAAAIDLAAQATPNDKRPSDLALARARLLCLLGEKEGEALFDRYAEHIKDEVDPYWVQSLLAEEIRAGLKDRAFSHAAKALSVAPPKNYVTIAREKLYLAKLFPQQATTAETWWDILRRQFKEETPEALLKRLRELMEGKVAAKDLKAWIKDHVLSINITPLQLQKSKEAIAEGAILAGLDDWAVSLLQEVGHRDALLRLGDLLAAKKQWGKAAESYQQAWQKELALKERETHDPLPLYLAGEALIHLGREKEGRKLIAQAHEVPFADAAMRYNFLRALTERGHKEAAQQEAELMLRVSKPNSLYSNEALRRLAFVAGTHKDYLRAAEGFEKSMLLCLKANMSFVVSAAYVQVPAQIHKWRALGLLHAGKFNEALRQVELALAHSPGYADLPIALVPELERRGHKKEAEALFNRCYAVYEKACRDYPRCAWAHNVAAWMSACCRRNLDQALEHAQKAVELAPTNAGYLDTLAEVHFQRGDQDKALALQKRVIELDPKRPYFRKQLRRLQAGDPSAERPSEEEN